MCELACVSMCLCVVVMVGRVCVVRDSGLRGVISH